MSKQINATPYNIGNPSKAIRPLPVSLLNPIKSRVLSSVRLFNSWYKSNGVFHRKSGRSHKLLLAKIRVLIGVYTHVQQFEFNIGFTTFLLWVISVLVSGVQA